MSKKISIGTKPMVKAALSAADTWVENRGLDNENEPMKRLTIDIPASLHRAIKTQCAMRGSKISEELRELLLLKYSKK